MEAYLDNSATTMAYPEVGELVYKVMCRDYGNPSSMHRKGVDAEHYVKGAKESLAKLMKVNAKEIFFTSGGTESDNLALIGCARANRRESSDHYVHRASRHFKYDAVSGRRGRLPCDLSAGRLLRTGQAGCIKRSVMPGDDPGIDHVCE